jgi:hypothetical protein
LFLKNYPENKSELNSNFGSDLIFLAQLYEVFFKK